MPGFHLPELVIVMVIALVVFGPRKLPEIGAAIGKSIKSFKGAIAEPAPPSTALDKPISE